MTMKNSLDDMDQLDALCFSLQAKAVMQAAFRNANERADDYHGLRMLIEIANNDLYTANAQEDDESLEKASCSLAGALGILSTYNSDVVDDELLYAVQTLLQMSKKRADEQLEARMRAPESASETAVGKHD